MNTDDRQDYQRYKEYVQEGYAEFKDAVEWFENGMSRERPRAQEKLSKMFRDMKRQGMTDYQISEITGISRQQVGEVIYNSFGAISEKRAELAIEELTS